MSSEERFKWKQEEEQERQEEKEKRDWVHEIEQLEKELLAEGPYEDQIVIREEESEQFQVDFQEKREEEVGEKQTEQDIENTLQLEEKPLVDIKQETETIIQSTNHLEILQEVEGEVREKVDLIHQDLNLSLIGQEKVHNFLEEEIQLKSDFFNFNDMEYSEGKLFQKTMLFRNSDHDKFRRMGIEIVFREENFIKAFSENSNEKLDIDSIKSALTLFNEEIKLISLRNEKHTDNVHLYIPKNSNIMMKREYNIVRMLLAIDNDKVCDVTSSLEDLGIGGIISPIHQDTRSDLFRSFLCHDPGIKEIYRNEEEFKALLKDPFIKMRLLIGTTEHEFTKILYHSKPELPNLYKFAMSLEFSAYHDEFRNLKPISPNLSMRNFLKEHQLTTVFETRTRKSFAEVSNSLFEIRSTERLLRLIELINQSEKGKIEKSSHFLRFLNIMKIDPSEVVVNGVIARREIRERIRNNFNILFNHIECKHDRGALQFGKVIKNDLSKADLILSKHLVSRIASLSVDFLLDAKDPRFLTIAQEMYNTGRNLWFGSRSPLNRRPEAAHTDIMMKAVTLTSMFFSSFNRLNTRISIDERWKPRELSAVSRFTRDVFPESASFYKNPKGAWQNIRELKINAFEYCAAPESVLSGERLLSKWDSHKMTRDLRLRCAYASTLYSLYKILGHTEEKSVQMTKNWIFEGSNTNWGDTALIQRITGKARRHQNFRRKHYAFHSRTPNSISLLTNVYGLYLGGEHGQGADGIVLSPIMDKKTTYEFDASLWEMKRKSVRIERQKINQRIHGSFSPSSKLLISNALSKDKFPMNHGQSYFGMFLFHYFDPNIKGNSVKFTPDNPAEFIPVKGTRQAGSIYYNIPPKETNIFLFRMRELQEFRNVTVKGSINVKELNLIGLQKTHPEKRNNMEFDLQVKDHKRLTEIFTTKGLRDLLIGGQTRGEWSKEILKRSIFPNSIPKMLNHEGRLTFWETKIDEIEKEHFSPGAKSIKVIRLMKEFADSDDFKNMLRDVFPSTNRSALGLMNGKNLSYENWRLLDICRVLDILWMGNPIETKYKRRNTYFQKGKLVE